MHSKDQELLGLLGGGLGAAAVHYSRNQDNVERRIDRADDRARDAQDQIHRWLNNGTVARLLITTVQDILAGVAMSSPAPQAPVNVPTTSVVNRPDLSGVQSATGNNWPPVAGTYDAEQRIASVGELTKFGLALTYEEVRTALLSFVLPTAPTLGNKVQIFNVLNALLHAVVERSLTWDQYKGAWDSFFNSAGQLFDPHRNPARVPTLSAFGNQVASVSLLSGSTDEVARFRVTASAGPGIVTGTNLFTMAFNTEYRGSVGGMSQPVAPIALAERLVAHELLPVGVTSTGYSVLLMSGSIAGGSSLDFKVLASPGIAPG